MGGWEQSVLVGVHASACFLMWECIGGQDSGCKNTLARDDDLITFSGEYAIEAGGRGSLTMPS